jgi:hypothetical protein
MATGASSVPKPLGECGRRFRFEIKRLIDESMQRQAVIDGQSAMSDEVRAHLLENEQRLLRESLTRCASDSVDSSRRAVVPTAPAGIVATTVVLLVVIVMASLYVTTTIVSENPPPDASEIVEFLTVFPDSALTAIQIAGPFLIAAGVAALLVQAVFYRSSLTNAIIAWSLLIFTGGILTHSEYWAPWFGLSFVVSVAAVSGRLAKRTT